MLLSNDTPDAVWGIAVDDTHVYWGCAARTVPCGAWTKQAELCRKALSSDELGINRIAVDTTGVYFTSHGVYRMGHDGSGLGGSRRKATPGSRSTRDFVYFTSRAKGEVYRMTKDGVGLTSLATASLANEVAVHGEFVVFTAHGDGLIRRVPRSGGPAIVIGFSNGGDGVAVDADGVYFTEIDSG